MLLRQLPPGSRTAVALHGELAGWTVERELLALNFDAAVAGNWQRAGNKNAPRPKPYPRPGQQPDRERLSRQLQSFQRRHDGAVKAHD